MYNISVLTDSHSSITPGNSSMSYGSTQSFTISLKSGYTISGISADGVDAGNLTFYSFTNITNNHTLKVTSAAIPSANTATTPTPTPIIDPETASTVTQPSDSPTDTQQPSDSQNDDASSALSITNIIEMVVGAMITVLFVLCFAKGFIKIEAEPEERIDYSI